MKLVANIYLSLIFSIIFTSLNASSIIEHTNLSEFSTMQRVRIDFESPDGFVRPLLLAFTTDDSATDGVDYGYDGANFDQFPDDLFWMIEDNTYVIQGVGSFEETKQYPLGLFLTNSGNIKISLNSLENFNQEIEVFVFDNLENTYTRINANNFDIDITSGEYLNRFFITFSNPNASNNGVSNGSLSIEEFNNEDLTSITYVSNSDQLIIKSNSTITHIEIYSITGQKIKRLNNIHSKEIKMPLQLNHKGYAIVKAFGLETHQSKSIILN